MKDGITEKYVPLHGMDLSEVEDLRKSSTRMISLLYGQDQCQWYHHLWISLGTPIINAQRMRTRVTVLCVLN